MAAIRHFTLTPTLTQELVRLLSQCADRTLVELVGPLLPGGFTKAKLIRKRLVAMIEGAAELPAWLVKFLEEQLPIRPAMHALAPEVLKGIAEALATLLGPAHFALALLLDEREELQQLGRQWAEKEPREWTEEEKRQARRVLQAFSQEYWLPFAQLTMGADPEAIEADEAVLGRADAAELDRLEKELARQTDQVRQLKTQLQEEKQLRYRKLKEAQAEAAAARRAADQKVAKLKQQAQQLRAAKESLERQLQTLQETQAARVSEEVQRQTSAHMRKWLADAVALEEFLAKEQSAATDLLARTEQVLAAQAEQDRHTGNRLELESRLNRLREARQRVMAAAGTALNPIAEMAPLLHDLELEIARVEKLLGVEAPAGGLRAKLAGQINQAGSAEELQQLEILLETLAQSDLMPARERRQLYQTLQRRLSVLVDSGRLTKGKAHRGGWSLGQALRQGVEVQLLIDGYNVLFRMPEVFAADFEEGRPGRQARDHLAVLVQRLVASREQAQVRLCFDGPQSAGRTLGANVRIEFSGGTGEDRADQVIAGYLEFLNAQPTGSNVYVVSDDAAVRRCALAHRAQYVPVDLFAALLAEFGCLT